MKTILQSQILLLVLMPFFIAAQQTSYDSDGDGIPDSTDQCMLVKGIATYKGCPYAKNIAANDRDGDRVRDVDDQCPDMFGLAESKGCPNLKEGTQSQQQALQSPNNSLFTTVSSLSREEDEAFKEILLRIVGDSLKSFPVVSSEPYTDVLNTSSCLPGALQCYIKTNTKIFYADFGQYSDEAGAANKYYTLKHRLSEALGENDWSGTEIASGNYINKYQLIKRDNNPNEPVITTHVLKTNNTYRVYITIEQK